MRNIAKTGVWQQASNHEKILITQREGKKIPSCPNRNQMTLMTLVYAVPLYAPNDTCRSQAIYKWAQVYQTVKRIINEQLESGLRFYSRVLESQYWVHDLLIVAHPESRFRQVERMRNSNKMTFWQTWHFKAVLVHDGELMFLARQQQNLIWKQNGQRRMKIGILLPRLSKFLSSYTAFE